MNPVPSISISIPALNHVVLLDSLWQRGVEFSPEWVFYIKTRLLKFKSQLEIIEQASVLPDLQNRNLDLYRLSIESAKDHVKQFLARFDDEMLKPARNLVVMINHAGYLERNIKNAIDYLAKSGQQTSTNDNLSSFVRPGMPDVLEKKNFQELLAEIQLPDEPADINDLYDQIKNFRYIILSKIADNKKALKEFARIFPVDGLGHLFGYPDIAKKLKAYAAGDDIDRVTKIEIDHAIKDFEKNPNLIFKP